MRRFLISLLKAPVKVYQYLISPLIPPRCRFVPTCSDYCLQALEKHGPLTGLWLTARRLLKCHPWSGQSGYDPVPEVQKNKPNDCSTNDCRHDQHTAE